jgi:hypothetical protein
LIHQDGTFKFCLLTVGQHDGSSRFAFFLRDVLQLAVADRSFVLTADEITLLNPNTGTCPIFRNRKDAEITKAIYRRVSVLVRAANPHQNPWSVAFLSMFHMANDSHLFRTRDQLEAAGLLLRGNEFANPQQRWLPLYEAKMIDIFDYRHGSYAGSLIGERPHMLPEASVEQKSNPCYVPEPCYWVSEEEVSDRLRRARWQSDWLLGWRDVTDSTNSTRTVVSVVLPRAAVSGKMPLLFPREPYVAGIVANLASLVLDYSARQKIGGKSLSMFIMRQLPILAPSVYERSCPWSASETLINWIQGRVAELAYTAWDLYSFGRECGASRPPFRWDEERRLLLRCELDAAFFHLYLTADGSGDWIRSDSESIEVLERLKASFPKPRDAVAYVMDTFPIVKRKDEQKFNGEYRTKRVILEIYDAMANSIRTGAAYETRINPPPADPSCCHAKKKLGILAFGSLINYPGAELGPKIAMRVKTKTPFDVKYGRYSGKTRGGAPTLVPHPKGSAVAAEILVMDDDVTIEEATNMLWRRECQQNDSKETYVEGTTTNSVLVRRFAEDLCVEAVLYTDFNVLGKIENPTAAGLAAAAIRSVAEAPEDKDGITYLADAISCGIETPLTSSYRDEILRRTGKMSLQEALKGARDACARTREAAAHE